MKIFENPSRESWVALCLRPSNPDSDVRERVAQIIERVQKGGDGALKELSLEIDGRDCPALELSPADIERACAEVTDDIKTAISLAKKNIEAFHKAQLPHEIRVESAPGVLCIQRPVPIEKVGLYIPGGTAPLFSTVLMLAVPAAIAGCRERVLCSPAGPDGEINPIVVYAASVCGVDRIFRVGGAQAIAAMAYGTESIPAVDKIFGPGNRYVTTAKQMVAADKVSIDMPAGPSEVMVIVDESSNPAYAAADLLSQAEHGRDSQVVLCAPSCEKAGEIIAEVGRQVEVLGRRELAEGALSKSLAVILRDEDDVVAFANSYAPEHLIISTALPWRIADRITAAGSVFVGCWTPESAGDYASGTNHTLPTCAWARSCSGVNVDSFLRKMTLQEISREGLRGLSKTIMDMADAEGLQAHANAVKTRIND